MRRHNDAKVFAALLAFRLVNGLVVRTYFDPDEYWQSLEVAHALVFGCASLPPFVVVAVVWH